MKSRHIKKETELDVLCTSVRKTVLKGDFRTSLELVCHAMELFPHAPQPHNLLGIILEKMGEHSMAMKHFRAAWALDPTYSPANHNLSIYGTFYSDGRCAFDESDIPPEPHKQMEIIYDADGIGRVCSGTTIEYDEHGIGHVVGR